MKTKIVRIIIISLSTISLVCGGILITPFIQGEVIGRIPLIIFYLPLMVLYFTWNLVRLKKLFQNKFLQTWLVLLLISIVLGWLGGDSPIADPLIHMSIIFLNGPFLIYAIRKNLKPLWTLVISILISIASIIATVYLLALVGLVDLTI